MLDFYARPDVPPVETILANLSDSEFYDTDIETEIPKKKKSVDATQSMACLLYTRECEKLNTRVQDLVIKQLSDDTVNIHHSNITTQGLIAVAQALKDNTAIIEVNLTDNAIDGDGACYLADCLIQNKSIKRLNVSSNEFGSKGAIVIGQMLKHNTGIEIIDLSHNKFEENDGQYLAAGLEWNDRLKELDLSHNNLSQDGAGFVGIAIGKNDSIWKLNISWNHIRRSGAVSFCKPLQRNYTLTHLNVSWNGFGYEGALAIGKLIQHNRSLQHIDASYNHINWKGATLIGEGLKQNKTLDTIKLGGNPLTTTGCMDIIEFVSKKTCMLNTLDLTGVPVISEFEMLASAIQQTRSFHYIHGGIVGTHDVLGQRLEKRVDPMQRVIDYMRERELRPTELFRSFDKAVGNKMNHRDFIERLKKSGIPIPKHDYEELIHQIETSNGLQDNGNITYSKMVEGVKEQIEKERIGRIKKREKEKKFRRRNKDILDTELPAIRDENSDTQDDGGSSFGRQTSFIRTSNGRSSANIFPGASTSMSSLGLNAATSTLSSAGTVFSMTSLIKPKKQPQVLISMSADLDQVGKKKTKKKKKKKTKK